MMELDLIEATLKTARAMYVMAPSVKEKQDWYELIMKLKKEKNLILGRLQ